MHLAAADATRAWREEQVALSEEKFERAGCGRSCFVRELIAQARLCGFSATRAGVVDPAVCHRCLHAGVLIRQMEKRARGPDSERLIAVQRVKPHASAALFVMHISADVEFEEVTDARHGRAEARANATHVKRHDGEPGIALERVHKQSRRQRALDVRRVPAPVQEGQLLPALQQHMLT